MSHYPFEWQVEDICAEEFNHFQNQFSQIIHQLIPFADGPVTFLDSAIDSGDGLHELNKPLKWLHYIKRVLRLQRSVLVPKKTVLFLPLWGNGSIVGIAVLEGVDDQFADMLSEEWLSDRSRIISRELFLQKQQAFDPVTGMFNGRHLQDTLDGELTKAQENGRHPDRGDFLQHVSLLMIEIYPRANNAEKALNYIIRAGYYLESFLGQGILHHLGNGVFGLIGENVDEDQAQKLGKNILGWLRREGFYRVHVGISTVGFKENATNNEAESRPVCHAVLEQTWQALRKARRRGPYSICTFSSISNPGPIL